MKRHIALDLETFLAGRELPKPVCVSWCEDDSSFVGVAGNNLIDQGKDPSEYITELEVTLSEIFRNCLTNNKATIWQNGAAFDLPVLWKHLPNLRKRIILLLENDLVKDTMIREKLHEISTTGEVDKPKGFYSLEGLAKRYLAIDLSKWKKGTDIWRLRYAELDGIPADKYPEAAWEYAVLDTDITNSVYKAQEALREESGPGSMNTEGLQVRSAFVLSLVSEEGLKIDFDALNEFEDTIADRIYPLKAFLIENEMAYNDKDGRFCKRNVEFCKYLEANYPDYIKRLPITQSEVDRAQNSCRVFVSKEKKKELRNYIKNKNLNGRDFPNEDYPDVYISGKDKDGEFKLTSAYKWNPLLYKKPLGNIDTSETALKEFPPDEIIKARLNIALYEKLGNTYCNNIRKAKGIFKSNYDVLKNTGRTSSFIQTFPRDLGVRELFIARPGKKIITIDISGHEFITTGQTDINLGLGDNWAKYLNKGDSPPDPHALLGHKWHEYRTGESVTPEEFQRRKESGDESIKYSRQQAKAPGLSFRGGGGNQTISIISKGEVTKDEVAQARELFESLIPEQRKALGSGGWVNKQKCTDSLTHTYAYEVNGRYRNYCTYAACANGKFMQSLAADSAKQALWQLFKAIWEKNLDQKVKIVFFIHDEIGFEVDEDICDDILPFLAENMCIGLAHYIPDIRISLEGATMDRWSKKEEYHERTFRAWRDPQSGRFTFKALTDKRQDNTLQRAGGPPSASPSSG